MPITNWDRRHLGLAEYVSRWSKDPSTQVGAVIVRPDKSIASMGFNGLPIGVADTEARLTLRDLKYPMIVHAEMNAMAFAREPLHGYTLYTWPFLPCPNCAGVAIQKGIARVVAPALPERLKERWAQDIYIAGVMLVEAGVEVEEATS